MSDTIPYAAEPNRVVSTGAVSLDAVGLSFAVQENRIVMEIRTGQIDERTIEVPYEEVQSVSITNDVAPGIEIETSNTEYEATDLSPSVREVDRVATAIRRSSPNITTERARSDGAKPNTTSTAPSEDAESQSDQARSTPEKTEQGSTDGGSDDSTVIAAPGEVMTCPECGGETAVPEGLPEQRQEASCPDCAETVGYVDESGDYIVVETASPD